MSKRYIQPAEPGLFDGLNRLVKIDAMGDPLKRLDDIIPWEIFIPILDCLSRPEPKGPGGRPAFQPLFMFKILILQSLNNLSDAQAQYHILDRASFCRFLGITTADEVPDQNTIREFREQLTRTGLYTDLFEAFNLRLAEVGLITRHGHAIDASFVEVPRQRNTRKENQSIKNGEIPEDWKESPKKLSHKDIDAKWAKKRDETYYGYKNHINMDLESKLIVRAVVTDAAVHDSQVLDDLTEAGDPETFMDAGYAGKPQEDILKSKEIPYQICEKGTRGKPLTKNQKRKNRAKSRKRSRVEHVFAFQTVTMKGMYKRYIGKIRNEAAIIFSNLTYNICRCEQIIRLKTMGRKTPSYL